jgi:YfiH family protein
MEWNDGEGLRWLEADLGDGARAVFSTRLGGVSEGPFEGLNLGVLTDDDPEFVRENRQRLAAALGLDPARIAFARQVHGAELEVHATDVPSRGSFGSNGVGTKPWDSLPELDGHVMKGPGVAGLVFGADCLPVAIAGPGGVAMLHCGWRGLAAGIVATGAAAVGGTDAAIGPGIGPCCYEVGDEVLSAFSHLGAGIAAADGPIRGAMADNSARRQRLDLAEVARLLLLEAGVERVEAAGLCTSCEAGLFFSHRRDAGRTGRQAGIAWIEPAAA